MKKIVQFEALGIEPVPWSVPEIGVANRGGKRVRFTTRSKKSKLALGKASLEDWQKHVANSAREAMATIPIQTGPLKIHFEFRVHPPDGKASGQIWDVPIRWNDDKGVFTKTQPRGKPEADVVNLMKGTEDALEGIVFENDVQTRIVSASMLYGPVDGVRVFVYQIGPEDFPGE